MKSIFGWKENSFEIEPGVGTALGFVGEYEDSSSGACLLIHHVALSTLYWYLAVDLCQYLGTEASAAWIVRP